MKSSQIVLAGFGGQGILLPAKYWHTPASRQKEM